MRMDHEIRQIIPSFKYSLVDCYCNSCGNTSEFNAGFTTGNGVDGALSVSFRGEFLRTASRERFARYSAGCSGRSERSTSRNSTRADCVRASSSCRTDGNSIPNRSSERFSSRETAECGAKADCSREPKKRNQTTRAAQTRTAHRFGGTEREVGICRSSLQRMFASKSQISNFKRSASSKPSWNSGGASHVIRINNHVSNDCLIIGLSSSRSSSESRNFIVGLRSISLWNAVTDRTYRLLNSHHTFH